MCETTTIVATKSPAGLRMTWEFEEWDIPFAETYTDDPEIGQ